MGGFFFGALCLRSGFSSNKTYQRRPSTSIFCFMSRHISALAFCNCCFSMFTNCFFLLIPGTQYSDSAAGFKMKQFIYKGKASNEKKERVEFFLSSIKISRRVNFGRR